MELKDAVFSLDYDGEDFEIPLEEGINLKGCVWKPTESPRFVYIFVHGLAVCVTFKKDLFPLILEKGGVVYGCDHYGHGRSPGERTSGTVDRMVEETIKVIKKAHEEYPSLPIVLHGHSMGGLCSIYTSITKYESDMKGIVKCVIAEAPWISPCPQRQLNSFEWYGIKLLSWITPNMLIHSNVEFYSDDMDKRFVDLCHERTDLVGSDELTPMLYLSVEEKQNFIHQHPELWPEELPLLFAQGKVDQLVDYKKSDIWVNKVLQR